MMTVGDLIDELSQYDDDTPVIIGYSSVQNVYLNPDFYFGDSPDNPARAFGSAVILE